MPTLIETGPSERGWSRLEAVLRCPQLFAYEYLLRDSLDVRTHSNSNRFNAVRRGELIHVGLAHHYARLRCAQQGTDPSEFYDVPTALKLAAEKRQTQQHLQLAMNVVSSYAAHYAEVDASYNVLGVETLVEAQVRGYRFTKRVDLILQHKTTGRVRLMDHKTTSRLDKAAERRYALSGGVHTMTYFGTGLYGDAFEGAWLNFIELGQPFRFKRVPVAAAPAVLHALPQTIQDGEERIAALAGRDPWNYPRVYSEQTCETRYGPCPYAELCRWEVK